MIYEQLGTTGIQLSRLSLGGAAFGGINVYGDYDSNEAEETIIEAIRQGINYIDVAPHYGLGQAENFLGKVTLLPRNVDFYEALHNYRRLSRGHFFVLTPKTKNEKFVNLKVLKKIPRDSYYISTKVGRFGNKFNFTGSAITKDFEDSLNRLNLNYADIIIVHDAEFSDSFDLILKETLPAVENLVRSKKAKYIGISGYSLSTLLDLVTNSKVKIDCVLTYTRDTLIDDSLQDYVAKFQEKGIGIINAGCVAMGLLSNQGPPSWHPALAVTKELCQLAADFCKTNQVEMGHLAVYHSLNQPGSCTCLVGMNDRRTLHTNLKILNNGLNEKENEILRELREKFFKSNPRHHWEGIELKLCKEKKL